MASGIRKIGIVGAGTMGRGIAQVFALHGFEAVLVDKSEEALASVLPKLKEHTAPEDWDRVAGLVRLTRDMDEARRCGLIIEAVYEDYEVKKDVLRSMGAIAGKDAVIATNTSSILIDELAVNVPDPSRFIGMHFMNPPKVMKLIEVIAGKETSQETLQKVVELSGEIGKIPAVVRDSPGFVTNRLLFALIGEAIRVLESGIASREAIDTVMKHGMNHPMGPLELADLIGLDVCRDTMRYISKRLDDEKYRPPDLLEELVRKGKLGRKTGEGFYKYP